MKKSFVLCLVLALLVGLFSACSNQTTAMETAPAEPAQPVSEVVQAAEPEPAEEAAAEPEQPEAPEAPAQPAAPAEQAPESPEATAPDAPAAPGNEVEFSTESENAGKGKSSATARSLGSVVSNTSAMRSPSTRTEPTKMRPSLTMVAL